MKPKEKKELITKLFNYGQEDGPITEKSDYWFYEGLAKLESEQHFDVRRKESGSQLKTDLQKKADYLHKVFLVRDDMRQLLHELRFSTGYDCSKFKESLFLSSMREFENYCLEELPKKDLTKRELGFPDYAEIEKIIKEIQECPQKIMAAIQDLYCAVYKLKPASKSFFRVFADGGMQIGGP